MSLISLNADGLLDRLSKNDGMKKLMLQIVYFLCGILAANAKLYGIYAPFGISLVAALPFSGIAAGFGGAFIGYFFFSVSGTGFRYIASMAAVIAIRWTLNDLKSINRRPLYPAIVCAVPVFATGLAILAVSGITLRLLSLYLLESLLGGAAAYFISRTIIMFTGTKTLGMLTIQELCCLALTGCIAILSLSAVTLGPVSLGRIAAILIILFSARYGGIAGGAVSGTATGAALSMASSELAFLGASYAFGGLIAGLFCQKGKISGITGFTLGAAVIAVQTAGGQELLSSLYELAAAALIFFVLPENAASFLRAVFISDDRDSTDGLRKSIIMRLDFASKALANVSDDVEEVSRRLSELVTPSLDNVYEKAVESTCSRCGMKVFCWEHRDGVSMSSFDCITDTLRKNGEIKPEELCEDFRKKCCRTAEIASAVNKCYSSYLASEAAEKRIDEVRQVVAGQFWGLSGILEEMAQEYADYRLFDTELSDRITIKLKELELKPTKVCCRVDNTGRMTIEAEVSGDGKKLRRALLVHELSKLCGRRFDMPTLTTAFGSSRLTLCERPALDVETACSQHICGDGRLCGDHLRYFTDGTGKMTAIISDGMGTGGRAAVDGGMASGIMEKLLKAGLGSDCSLKVVNSALLVKSSDESLATLDVVTIDLFSGHTEFMKAGAALSFIRKDGDIYRVETPSLPAGILPDIAFTCTEDELSEGDIIVMCSDGAVATGEEWIEHILSGWEDKSMQQLADTITDEACARRHDGHDDDITVIAMQLHGACPPA